MPRITFGSLVAGAAAWQLIGVITLVGFIIHGNDLHLGILMLFFEIMACQMLVMAGWLKS